MKRVLFVLLAGIFVFSTSVVIGQRSFEPVPRLGVTGQGFNAMVQIDGKSPAQIQAELMAQGVPGSAIQSLDLANAHS